MPYLLDATVELFDVALQRCRVYGLRATSSYSAATVVATRCEFANTQQVPKYLTLCY